MSSTEYPTTASSSSGSVPAWADVFDDDTIGHHFVDVVADVIEQRWGDTAVFDASIGRVVLANGCMIDFANTACELIGHDEPYWRSYLFLMLSAYDTFDPAALDAEIRSWSRIRHRLRIRLYPTASTPGDDWELIRRPVSNGLSFIVAADTELGCVPVAADAAAGWDTPLDRVWRTATENTRTRGEYRISAVQSPTARFAMLDGDLYTTGHARDLDTVLPGIIGPHGALVVAPTSRALFVQPIDDPRAVAADAVGLLVAATTFSTREPNPLVVDVLWYRGPDDLVGALDVGPGLRVRNVAPEPMSTWLEPG